MRHLAETVIDLGELGQTAVLVDFTYRPGRPARFSAAAEVWLPAEDELLDVHTVAHLRAASAASWPQLTAVAASLGVSLDRLLRDRLVAAAVEARGSAAERRTEERAGAALCGEG